MMGISPGVESKQTEMDTEEFRVRGKEMVDYICDYMNGLGSRPVYPSIEPGFLTNLIPSQAPDEPEDWDAIMADVDSKIMKGVCHWQHPRFHAYFPSGNSYPSIIADMLSDAIGSIAFSWVSITASCGRALGLPDEFLHSSPGSTGGGVIQGSASECILVSMLAARYQAVKHLKRNDPMAEDSSFLPKLVAYCSTEAHSCVEKAANICLVRLHILEPDGDCTLRGETLREAMEEDEKRGLFPFFVSATVGTTSSCAFDNLKEMGTVCCRYPSVWFHVDGAYAGNSFICPENRYLMNGIYYADSFNTNANKWLLVAFDCSCLWIKDRNKLTSALNVDPLYLQHKRSEQTIDYRHWGVPLSRRFRALKLWFVLRRYGIQGLQAYIRNHCRLAKRFEGLIRKDDRFQVINDLGLVCFRLNGTDRLNQDLLANINTSGKLHIIPSMVKGQYIIRFCVTAEHAKDEDIGVPLAAPKIPRLLPVGQLLPFHHRRHAVRRHWQYRLLLGKALALPEEFLASPPGSRGGGVIQGSASECILVSMLAARNQAVQYLKKDVPDAEDSSFLPLLVAYCSTESHSCVEKAAMISLVKLRILEPDENCSLRGDTLLKAMEEDEAKGLFPFFVSTTLGTTSSCAFDNLKEIGPVCRMYPSVWFHVDGAYAGNSFICPENRYLMNGIHYADSFNTNTNKWLLVAFDCSCLWIKDRNKLTSALNVDPLYLQHKRSEETIDYRHWGIPLSRRFRALKLWFVLRRYGIQGLQAYIRNHCRLAKRFEGLVRKDSRFEVINDVKMGLVCFRVNGTDRLNQELLANINASGKLHMIPSLVKCRYIIRFCVTAEHAKDEDIGEAISSSSNDGQTTRV
uniref:Tyrosine decarboxylase n=1 Tax=Timema monikensis TaxID=170555 RepID=A0A7R9HS23_9NEOP|nr:unnamed protein product [Timema monikensis]